MVIWMQCVCVQYCVYESGVLMDGSVCSKPWSSSWSLDMIVMEFQIDIHYPQRILLTLDVLYGAMTRFPQLEIVRVYSWPQRMKPSTLGSPWAFLHHLFTQYCLIKADGHQFIVQVHAAHRINPGDFNNPHDISSRAILKTNFPNATVRHSSWFEHWKMCSTAHNYLKIQKAPVTRPEEMKMFNSI